MTDTTRISVVAATAEAIAIAGLLDFGRLALFPGRQPASPDTSANSLPLAEVSLLAARVANGVVSLTPEPGMGMAEGRAGWFRVYSAKGIPVWDGSVGTKGATLNLDSTVIVPGVEVTITSLTFRV